MAGWKMVIDAGEDREKEITVSSDCWKVKGRQEGRKEAERRHECMIRNYRCGKGKL